MQSELKDILTRARNLLSQPEHWVDTPSWKESANKLSLEIEQYLNSNKSVTDYAWPTVSDYEKDAGFEVNFAFESGWRMARTTNGLFDLMNKG